MKPSVFLSAMVFAVIFAAHGCMECDTGPGARRMNRVKGSGNVTTEERQVSGLTGVNLATVGDLYVKLGDSEELFVEAEDNLLRYFKTEVDNGVLRIRTRRKVNLRPTRPIKYYLTLKELDTIVLSSAGDATLPDLAAETFRIVSSSSGDLETGDLDVQTLHVRMSSSGGVEVANLNAARLDVSISSSGRLKILGGQVEEQDINLSSSGDYEARDLASATAAVRVSSSGDAVVRVSHRLDATSSSSGYVYYIGNPSVSKRISSSGKVVQMSD